MVWLTLIGQNGPSKELSLLWLLNGAREKQGWSGERQLGGRNLLCCGASCEGGLGVRAQA